MDTELGPTVNLLLYAVTFAATAVVLVVTLGRLSSGRWAVLAAIGAGLSLVGNLPLLLAQIQLQFFGSFDLFRILTDVYLTTPLTLIQTGGWVLLMVAIVADRAAGGARPAGPSVPTQPYSGPDAR